MPRFSSRCYSPLPSKSLNVGLPYLIQTAQTKKGRSTRLTLLETSMWMTTIPDATQATIQNSTSNNSTTTEEQRKILAEAEELRERAKALRKEALAEEALLKESRSSQQRHRIKESDDMVDRLFLDVGLVPANTTIAAAVEEHLTRILRSERWSPQQVLLVLERLQERQTRVQDQPSILTPSQAAVNRPSSFQIGDTRNAATANETEWNVLDGWISSLINAATYLDDEYNDKMTTAKSDTKSPASEDKKQSALEEGSSPVYNSRWTGRVAVALKTRRKEMIRAEEEELKRKIAANVNAVVRASKTLSDNSATATPSAVPDDIQEYARQTLGIPSGDETETKQTRSLNVTRVVDRVQAVPMWVPASLLPLLVKSRATLRKEDVNIIKDRVLVGSRFFCTSSDAIPSAAIFRGNIRTSVGLVDMTTAESERSNHTAVVLEEIQQRLEAQGLNERVQLFMMEDPEWRPGKDARIPKPLPVLLAISQKVEPTESTMEKAATSKIAKVCTAHLLFLCRNPPKPAN